MTAGMENKGERLTLAVIALALASPVALAWLLGIGDKSLNLMGVAWFCSTVFGAMFVMVFALKAYDYFFGL